MEQINSGINCPKCGARMQVQAVAVKKHRSIFEMLAYLLLACFTAGFALLLFARGKGDKVETFALCPNCGYRERIK